MRTNIVLNDKLVSEAFRYSKAASKRELIDQALREFIENHRRKDVRELKSKIKIVDDYNYKELREGKK